MLHQAVGWRTGMTHIALVVLALFVGAPGASHADDIKLTPAGSVDAAIRGFDARARDIAEFNADRGLEPKLGLAFGSVALAKLLLPDRPCRPDQPQKSDAQCLREALNERRVEARVGTTFDDLKIDLPDPFGSI